MRKRTICIMVMALVLAGFAQAAVVTLNCTKDTYVQDGSEAGTPFGDSNQLRLGAGTVAGQSRMIYAAFTTLPLNTIALEDIQSATLKMYCVLQSGAVVTTGPLDRPRFAWDENLTWSTQGTDFASVGTWSFSPDPSREGYYILTADVTDLVKYWKTGGIVNNGIRVRHYGGTPYTMAIFDSTEETTRGLPPVIEVTYVPEPASLGLLSLGGLMFLRRRK